MAPEYGATCGFFPIDERTLDYLRLTGREDGQIALVRAYRQAQGLWRDASAPDPVFTDTLELDMSTVEPSLAGPEAPAGQGAAHRRRRPVQRRARRRPTSKHNDPRVPVEGEDHRPRQWRRGDRRDHQLHQHLQPVGADRRRARRPQGAREGARRRKPWVKTSLAPGSQVVTDYLDASGPQRGSRRDRLRPRRLWLHHLHRQFGAAAPSRSARRSTTTTWSRLGPLGQPQFRRPRIARLRANYLASPPLVVAYALKGTVRSDMVNEPIGTAQQRRRRLSSRTSGRPTRRSAR